MRKTTLPDPSGIHQEKLALIGQLATGIAHEINNPITFVNLNLEALLEYAEALQSAVRRCRSLCADSHGSPCEETLASIDGILGESSLARALEDLPKLGRE